MSYSTALNLKICISMTPTTLPSRAISPRPAHLLAPAMLKCPSRVSESSSGNSVARRRKKRKALPNGSAWATISTHVKLERPAVAGRASVTKTTIGTVALSRICVHAFWVRRMGPLPMMRRLRPLRLRYRPMFSLCRRALRFRPIRSLQHMKLRCAMRHLRAIRSKPLKRFSKSIPSPPAISTLRCGSLLLVPSLPTTAASKRSSPSMHPKCVAPLS